MFTVLGFYKFKKLDQLSKKKIFLQKYFIENNIKGTLILSKEGINGTISGKSINISYINKKIKSFLRFSKFDSENLSKSNFQPFHKPKVKIKKEVVPMGLKILPKAKKDNHLTPSKWNNLIKNKNTLVLDARKPFEYEVGTFKKAINPNVKHFREFPKYLNKLDKKKPVYLYCRSGNRSKKSADILLEMGFSEIEGDYVQSAGWNMDALFIPQSHPARTMQDTFYLSNPDKIEVDEKYLDLWANVHENGHDTGSKGWGAEFDKEESKKALLRTHTTVNTVRHIANNPDLPSKVFGIGRVFRQETIDRTHLPEFHQIEGIIHEPNANLSMLISTLKTFYSKMGYPDVRVRPAYFPYTEPSVEVDILWRGEWLELGGAGIFRPEVTEPLGTEWPVCAWGMGLERLAMLILDLDDIRQLYQPDLERLQKMPLI